MSEPRFAIITAARDEAATIGFTLVSLARQTILPTLWVLVDDGSADDTGAWMEAAAHRHPWILPVSRPREGARDTGSRLVAALTFGFSQLNLRDYEFLFVLDADILLGPRYYEVILEKFRGRPRLGVATGTVWDLTDGKVQAMRGQQYGTIGAVKGWRRECFEELEGLAPGEGWEGIDSLKALRRGWEAVTFPDPELRTLHLKPRTKGWRRHGRALHFAGASPLWVLASGFYHLASRPYIYAGLDLWRGYLDAWRERAPRYEDPGFREFQRRWHMKHLLSLGRGWHAAAGPT